MKITRLSLILIFSWISLMVKAQSVAEFTNHVNSFMNQHVQSGLVDYATLSEDNSSLNKLVNEIKSMDLASANAAEKKTFYINAYNVLVIHQAVKNYPLESVLKVEGFFDRNKFDVAGEKLTLNNIENKKIREVYKDPRIHFVLVCGAKGCPPIISEAYQVDKLDAQLDRQTKIAMNNDQFIQVDNSGKQAKFSEIFKWYEGDFKADGGNLAYVNKYRNSKIPSDYKTGYYSYDWSLNLAPKKKVETKTGMLDNPPAEEEPKTINLQEYTPSVLLSKGQWEFKSFQNMYTQTGGYGEYNKYEDYGSRSTFFTSINQFTYGINKRFNVGADLWIKSVRYGEKDDSPLEVFQFETNPQSRTELSTIGPRIRVNPFEKLSHFAINTTFLIPVAEDQNGSESNEKAWLASDAYIWLTQVYYDQALGDKFQLFFQLAPWYTIQKPGEAAPNRFEMPFDVFVSYFPTKRLSFYMQQEFWPTFIPDEGLNSYFFQGGLGTKYQVIPGFLELELSYTDFYYGKSAGAGQTFNLGIRLLGGN